MKSIINYISLILLVYLIIEFNDFAVPFIIGMCVPTLYCFISEYIEFYKSNKEANIKAEIKVSEWWNSLSPEVQEELHNKYYPTKVFGKLESPYTKFSIYWEEKY